MQARQLSDSPARSLNLSLRVRLSASQVTKLTCSPLAIQRQCIQGVLTLFEMSYVIHGWRLTLEQFARIAPVRRCSRETLGDKRRPTNASPTVAPKQARDDDKNGPETARDTGGPETAEDDPGNRGSETARDDQKDVPATGSRDEANTPETAKDSLARQTLRMRPLRAGPWATRNSRSAARTWLPLRKSLILGHP
jgi:hypothetical protein